MYHFLLPSDPFSPKEPDEMFRTQFVALRDAGLGVSLFSFEDLGSTSARIRGDIPNGAAVVYRGWMVPADDYDRIVTLIQNGGGIPLTSPQQYLACHHLPNWYPLLADLTAETKILPVDARFDRELPALGWGRFFIKDYVKSLKTSVGSVVTGPEEMQILLTEMEKFRGTIEGGVCVRRFEAFVPGTERRYFVVGGVGYAPASDVPELVGEVARRIHSPFFAVDIAEREDGELRVVEVGDGQVSDLVGWEARRFAEIWNRGC
jgi:hypothetical protein